MKITNISKDETCLSKLSNGDVFKLEDTYYLVVDDDYTDNFFQVFNLSKKCLTLKADCEKVIYCDTELLIKERR